MKTVWIAFRRWLWQRELASAEAFRRGLETTIANERIRARCAVEYAETMVAQLSRDLMIEEARNES